MHNEAYEAPRGEIIVRKYQSPDWESIRDIHDAARMEELRLAGLAEAFLPLEVAAEREGLFGYGIFVAELNGEPAGFDACSEDELAWLYVHPRFFRRGVGRRLAEEVLAHTGRPVWAEVLAGNAPAAALYRRLGFAEKEVCTGHMPGNEKFVVTVSRLCLEK